MDRAAALIFQNFQGLLTLVKNTEPYPKTADFPLLFILDEVRRVFDLLNGTSVHIPLLVQTIEQAETKAQDYAPRFRPCTWSVLKGNKIILKGKILQ